MNETEDICDFEKEGSSHDREKSLEPASPNSSNFSTCSYYMNSEKIISKSQYISNIAAYFRDSETRIAASTSTSHVNVFNISDENFTDVFTTRAHKKPVTGLRFAHENDNHLYTSSLDGTVKLWDLKNSEKVAQTFKGVPDKNRPITCFDITCDDRFICAGTEVSGGSAFLLFWDVRSTKLLGGYWETHTEEITQVKCHPNEKSHMITGCMDGLMNVFNIKETCEDDALIDSLNTELDVEKVGWLPMTESVYCITCSDDLQIWQLIDTSPSVQFTRQDISDFGKMKYSDNCYAVDVHSDAEGNTFLLAGSNLGCGDCLRVMPFSKTFKSVTSLPGNKQCVRTSVYDVKHNCIITGGEKGIINIWKPDNGQVTSTVNKIQTQKNISRRTKPY